MSPKTSAKAAAAEETNEDVNTEATAADEAEPNWDAEPPAEDDDEISGDEDGDEEIVITEEHFVLPKSYKNALAAPINEWLPFLITDVKVEDSRFNKGAKTVVISAEHESTAFGGRRFAYRIYLDTKPREMKGGKMGEFILPKFIAATGAVPLGKSFRASELPDLLPYSYSFMGQLYHAKDKDKEFSVEVSFGENLAVISPVTGHHLCDVNYSIVPYSDRTDEMLEDPNYLVHTEINDEGQEFTEVLVPDLDEEKIQAAIQKAMDAEDSDIDPEILETVQHLAENKACKRQYYNTERSELTVAGAAFLDGDEEKILSPDTNQVAVFGSGDSVFGDEGYGAEVGSPITAYDGSVYTVNVKVPAKKLDVAKMSNEEKIRREKLSPTMFAPMPVSLLGVKEDGPDVEPHYQVQPNFLRFLAIGDTPVEPNTEVDAVDTNSDTGQLVRLRYGADSAWHVAEDEA